MKIHEVWVVKRIIWYQILYQGYCTFSSLPSFNSVQVNFIPIPKMASPICFYLLFLSLLSQTQLSFSTTHTPIDHGRPLVTSIADVHDLLPKYGLPKGIVPNNVKSYTLSSTGDFTIELESTCYVQFDDLVYYDKTISGKLSYGAVHDVSGIQAKKLFLWLPVTGIEVNGKSGMVQFFVGAFSKEFPAVQFEDIPVCKRKAVLRVDLFASM